MSSRVIAATAGNDTQLSSLKQSPSFGGWTGTADEIEEALAKTLPFADSYYLHSCLWKRYESRLKMLSEYCPQAKAILDNFGQVDEECKYRVIGDPAVRTAIDRSLAYFHFGHNTTEQESLQETLRAAVKLLKSGRSASLLNASVAPELRTEKSPHAAWIWTDERENDAATVTFRRLYQEMEGNRSVLVTPNSEELHSLVQSVELLNTILPQIARSALDHLHLMAVSDVPPGDGNKKLSFTSFTALHIPSTIFINRTVLRNPWKAAESILHEALHLKLYDFQHTHSLLRSGYKIESSPTIYSVWNRPLPHVSNAWPVCRSLFAFHVYVYLSFFFTRAQENLRELESRFGSKQEVNLQLSARRAFDRAHHLGFHISQFKQELGPAGQALVKWLTEYLEHADIASPVPGSYVHLLLDLYQREGEQVAEQRAKSTSPEEQEKLERMMAAEVGLAQQITATCGPSFATVSKAHKSTGSLVDSFRATRKWVFETLQSISPAQAEMDITPGLPQKTVGQAIEDLVLTSGGVIA